jgi:hypothetical protein
MPPSHATMGDPQQRQVQPDHIDPAPELPKGTVVANIVDTEERPVAGIEVRLGVMFESVAEGQKRTELKNKTNERGLTQFNGLVPGSSYSYRVTVKKDGADFASTPFQLKETGGLSVTVHLFPVIHELAGAAVGLRGLMYIETRDDSFQVEGIFRVINLGHAAWVPHDVVIGLPANFKAFNGQDSMFGTKFEAEEGRGAKLVGTYPPGQRDLNFRFQVPKESSSTAVFRFVPAPRTAEFRVFAAAGPSMGMEVDGFEPAIRDRGPSGDPVLVTGKRAGRGQPELGPVVVTLTGLPVPSAGRWVAIAIAIVFAGAGGLAALGKWRLVSGEKLDTDRSRACDLLLDELVALTRARARGEVGPETHQRTHRTLIDALTRIGLPSEPKTKKRLQKAQRA